MTRVYYIFLFLAILRLSSVHAQVHVGSQTQSQSTSSILSLNANNKGFLPPRMNTLERESIVNPEEGLLIYNTDINVFEVFVGFGWRNLSAVVGNTDIISPKTGLIWMDRNIGATRVASFYTDDQAFGYLYQWGRSSDGHQIYLLNPQATSCPLTYCIDGDVASNRPNDATDSGIWDGKFILRTENNWLTNTNANNNLWNGVNGVNNPCPFGYRLPTIAEWQAEVNSWGGVNIQNPGQVAYNRLKLTSAGRRERMNGRNLSAGSSAWYWSSTVSSSQARSVSLNINSFGILFVDASRSHGMAVRCIKD